MENAVIVSACRTAVGKFLGGLSTIPAGKLGAIVVAEAIKRAGIEPDLVEECIMGNVLQAGVGQNPARQAAHWGGVPDEVGSFTVNKVCGSGLKAVMLAAQAIKAGDADVIVAGGMESMSQAPYLLPKAPHRLSAGRRTSWWTPWCTTASGTSSTTSTWGARPSSSREKFKVSREDQDEYAVGSQQKAVAAIEAGRFKDEIVPVEVPQRKGDPDHGRHRRGSARRHHRWRRWPSSSRPSRRTARSPPATPPSVNDGAAALVVMSETRGQGAGREAAGAHRRLLPPAAPSPRCCSTRRWWRCRSSWRRWAWTSTTAI